MTQHNLLNQDFIKSKGFKKINKKVAQLSDFFIYLVINSFV